MITDDLLQKYDRPAPRYTSFPTAVQFSDAVGYDDMTEQLTGLDGASPVSLYVHIPFCHKLCHYCGCHTKVANSYTPIQSYLSYLQREIEIAARHLSYKPRVSSLHFGGGTPNILRSDDMNALIDTLKTYFQFDKKTGIDIETDPRLLTSETIENLASAGITRISLGVQDFNPDVQRAIGRIQPFEKVRDNVGALRGNGITHINFDLMVGLPLQTVDNVRRNAELALSLHPDRIAVFAYAHVPWMKKHQTLLEKYSLPGTRARYDMVAAMDGIFTDGPYHPIGIDHYAHKDDSLYQASINGTLHRNFQGYTSEPTQTIIGFGLSAISSFPGSYIQNTTDAADYRAAIMQDRLPVVRGLYLTDEDKHRRNLIETIMCRFAAPANEFDALNYDRATLQEMQQDGLVELTPSGMRITDAGKPFTRIAAACFDPYFTAAQNRHAKAI